MKWWALASGAVLVATVAGIVTVIASPDWLPYVCSTDGDSTSCSSVNPLLIGFVGILASLALLFVGFVRSDR